MFLFCIGDLVLVYDENKTIDFLKINQQLAPNFRSIRENLKKHFISERHASIFLQNDIDLFKANVVSNLFDCENLIKLELAYLTLFPIVERCLGNLIYSIYYFNASKVPFLLKDLVNDCQLAKFFSIQQQNLIGLLKLLVYTPKSLNLRYLSWHGFLNPNQYNQDYIHFFKALICAINYELNAKVKYGELNLKPRNKLSLDKVKINQENLKLFSNFRNKHRNNCIKVIENSHLIEEIRRPLWKYVYEDSEESSFNLMIYILPQLEHILRKLYSLVNVSDYDVEIAYTDEFYLTINHLLQLKLGNNETNYLIRLIGNGKLIFLIFEYLNYLDGPRLRDRLSHGELKPSEVCDEHFLNVLLFTCIQLAKLVIEVDGINEESAFNDFSNSIYHNYEPTYHPITCLQSELFSLLELSSELNDKLAEQRLDCQIRTV